MNEQPLHPAVRKLAESTRFLPDEILSRDYTWGDHDEGLRFALLGSYHELRDLAAALTVGRQVEGDPLTQAQIVLGQYHAAFRDLEAILLGASDEILDRPPAEDEWPLRQVMAHMIGADRGFFALVYYALDQYRSGLEPVRPEATVLVSLYGPLEDFDEVMEGGNLAAIMNYHQDHHDRILHEFADLNDEELWALSRFWEPEPKTVRYRLHRFDAHLRQHTIQAQKTLAALGFYPSEALHLLRLVYNALAEVEGSLIGAWDFGFSHCEELAATIRDRSADVAARTGEA